MAEIFSRYYDKDVRMHGFDNGTATRVKRDNWGQLTRFFQKARAASPYASSVADALCDRVNGVRGDSSSFSSCLRAYQYHLKSIRTEPEGNNVLEMGDSYVLGV